MSLKTEQPQSPIGKRNLIHPDSVVLHRHIGRGSTGSTYLGTCMDLNKEVAVKVMYDEGLSRQQQKRIRREAKFLNRLHHPNVCKLYGEVEASGHLCLVMEYCSGGDMCDLINRNGPLTEQKARHLFGQLLSAVQYIHSKGIIHRDIKLDNLFLDAEHKRLVLGDFGLASKFSPQKKTKEYVGSLNYVAPEVLEHRPFVGPPSEVWSCGVVLYAMVTGVLPFSGDDDTVLEAVVSGQVQFPSSPTLSIMLSNLLKRMLEPDPEKRITVDGILVHPWMTADSEKKHNRRNSALGLKTISACKYKIIGAMRRNVIPQGESLPRMSAEV
jgi:serine/threonine protein kinase